MCQCDRLCFLQMGESRHIGVNVLFHDFFECYQHLFDECINLGDLIADIKFHIEGYLVIAASSGVQLLSGVSDAVNQVCLHEAVDILIFAGDFQFSALYVGKNAFQSFQNLISFVFCQNALFCQHLYMCHAAFDVLFIEFLIKADGCIKIIH